MLNKEEIHTYEPEIMDGGSYKNKIDKWDLLPSQQMGPLVRRMGKGICYNMSSYYKKQKEHQVKTNYIAYLSSIRKKCI